MIFTGAAGNSEIEIPADTCRLLESLGTKWTETPSPVPDGDSPKPGPYIASKGALLEVLRLYDDTRGAFMNSLILHKQK